MPSNDNKDVKKINELDSEGGAYRELLKRFKLPLHHEFDANMYSVMLHLDNSARLSKSLSEWLLSKANQHFCNALIYRTFHYIEAVAYMESYRAGFDDKDLFAACDHLVRAQKPNECLDLLKEFAVVASRDRASVRCFYFKAYANALAANGMIDQALDYMQKAYAENKQEKSLTLPLFELNLLNENYIEALDFLTKANLPEFMMRHELKRVVVSMRGASKTCAVKALISINRTKYAFLSSLLSKKQRKMYE